MAITKKTIALFIVGLYSCALLAYRKPRLIVVVTVDQFSYNKLMECKPYLKGGLHNLLEHGIVYHNMYQPHGLPSTATGHTALSTGTYACTHGISGNAWYNTDGVKVACDDDNNPESFVFSTHDMHHYGKSPHNLMVDTITDQFILSSEPYAQHTSYSISFKSRSAILTAGKLGKALWFDPETGWFTSSKAYFDKLPAWVIRFNKKKRLNEMTSITWNRAYTSRDFPYRMFSKDPSSLGLFGKTIPFDRTASEPYEYFSQTPAANSLIFELARTCIDEHVSRNPDNQLLIWLCPGALDRAGHEFGADSLHITDLIYHLDLELFRFYNAITKHVRKKDVLIVLTADHGIGNAPEKMQEKGYTGAHRIMADQLKKYLNTVAYKETGYHQMIVGIKAPGIFFDLKKLQKLPQEKQDALMAACKSVIQKHPGVKKVWTYQELQNTTIEPKSLSAYFKHQAYPGRSGQLIVEPEPYCFMTQYHQGTSHKSPYNYDTHIPFIIYQSGSYERASIYDQVLSLQFAPTLAHIIGIPRPSACTHALLPGVTPTNDPCF